MLKTRLKTVFAVSLIFWLVACGGGSKINEGEITGKSYRAAWTQHGGFMAGKVWIPQIIHHPEAWFLLIDDGKQTGYCIVSKSDLDRFDIGVWITCN